MIKESLELASAKNNEIGRPYDLSQIGDNDLVVREEKKVSISWSRDNSPAPTDLKSNSSVPEIGIKQLPSDKSASSHNNNKLPLLESRKSSSSQQENPNQGRNDKAEVELLAERRDLDKIDESEKSEKASSRDKPSQGRVRLVFLISNLNLNINFHIKFMLCKLINNFIFITDLSQQRKWLKL